MLWIVPSRLTLRFVGRISASESGRRLIADGTGLPIIWAVEAVSKFVPRASCLTQAIAAKLLLRRFGQDAQLCLGVAHTEDGTLRAHAWLEREGHPVLGGSGIHSMVRLPVLPDGAHIPASLTRRWPSL